MTRKKKDTLYSIIDHFWKFCYREFPDLMMVGPGADKVKGRKSAIVHYQWEETNSTYEDRISYRKFWNYGLPDLTLLDVPDGTKFFREGFWYQSPNDDKGADILYQLTFTGPVEINDDFYYNVQELFERNRKKRLSEGMPDVPVTVCIETRIKKNDSSFLEECDKAYFTIEPEQEQEHEI